MNKRALGIAALAILITTVVGFLLRNQIVGKLANQAFYRFYDWVMGIPC